MSLTILSTYFLTEQTLRASNTSILHACGVLNSSAVLASADACLEADAQLS